MCARASVGDLRAQDTEVANLNGVEPSRMGEAFSSLYDSSPSVTCAVTSTRSDICSERHEASRRAKRWYALTLVFKDVRLRSGYSGGLW